MEAEHRHLWSPGIRSYSGNEEFVYQWCTICGLERDRT